MAGKKNTRKNSKDLSPAEQQRRARAQQAARRKAARKAAGQRSQENLSRGLTAGGTPRSERPSAVARLARSLGGRKGRK